MLTLNELKQQILQAGLDNSTLCLHSSFRSFGPVVGGAQTVIDALVQSGCTLVCPAFFYQSQTYPSRVNYANNGVDYSKIGRMLSVNYTGSSEQIEPSMGAIARLLLKQPNTSRTQHPANAFSVCGPLHQSLLANQSMLNAYSVYKNIHHSSQPAYVVLAGVDFTSCTPIHYAEEVAGRQLFRRWSVYNGQVVETEEGSCSNGFEQLRPLVKHLEKVVTLGQSETKIYPFKPFIDTLSESIRAHPQSTHCGDDECARCHDMTLGGRASE